MHGPCRGPRSYLSEMYVPNFGDVVWVDFDPQAGREQSGRRPAVVLSAKAYNQKANLALICPITSRVKGYPFEIALPDALPVSGVILCDHLKSIDWQVRRVDFICELPAEFAQKVAHKTQLLIGP